MKNGRLNGALTVIGLLLLLGLAVTAPVHAQDDPVPEGLQISGDPSIYAVEDDAESAPVQDAAQDLVLAQPPYTLNYQGYLTNSGGAPLSGAYDMEVSLYNVASGGSQRWGPEMHNDVDVASGLFVLVLGNAVPLTPDVFGEALFLSVTVEGTLLPRQALRPSAYAFALVPGAVVQGDPAGTDYALNVVNSGVDATDSGVYASGNQYGLYAEETGPGDEAIYADGFVRADGYRSRSDSYIFAAGTEGYPWSEATDLHMETWYYGRAQLYKTTAGPGTRTYFLPIQLPAVLYGQDVTVEDVTVYYFTSDPDTYITDTRLYKQTSASSADTIYSDVTDHTSTTATSYSFTPSQPDNTLNADAGILVLRLQIQFEDEFDSLNVGGVRVRLGHS